MKYGSVCSGIEAASVAWESLGWQAQFFSEIDPFACALLAQRFPNVPNLGDMTKFKEWPDYADLDVLVGGTPCQSFSVAGLRAGLSDPRGNLSLTFLAIANRYRPRWVVWENVPGVLSSISHAAPDLSPPPDPVDVERDGQEVDTVDEYDSEELHAFVALLAGFSELGYKWAFRTLDAQHFGVPQRRRRVFVVGYLGEWEGSLAALFERESLSGNPAPSRAARKDVTGSIAARTRSGGGLGTDFKCDGGLQVARPLRSQHNASLREDSDTYVPEILGTLTTGDGSDGRDLEAGKLVAFGGNNTAGPIDVAAALLSHGTRGDFESETFIADGDRVAHSLRAEGFDASEDGSGRGLPLVPMAPTAYDLAQVTSLKNFSNPKPGDPCHPLTVSARETVLAEVTPIQGDAQRDGISRTPSADAEGRVRLRDSGLGIGKPGDPSYTLTASAPPAIAFTTKGDGVDAGELSPTLRAMNNVTSNASGGGQVGVAFGFNARQDPDAWQDRTGPLDVDPYTQAVAFEARVARNGRGAPSDIVPPLKAQSGESGKGDAAPLAVTDAGLRVRRITPREAERLQGFPDDWTAIRYGVGVRGAELGIAVGLDDVGFDRDEDDEFTDTAPQETDSASPVAADGPRYKAIGNSMAVPVMRWIGERIEKVERLWKEHKAASSGADTKSATPATKAKPAPRRRTGKR